MIEALAEFLISMSERLLGRFRRLLDRLPDRDPSTLPWWHRLARLIPGVALSLAILILLGWWIWR